MADAERSLPQNGKLAGSEQNSGCRGAPVFGRRFQAVGATGFDRRLQPTGTRQSAGATMKLEPDIDNAAISGRSTRPNAGSNTPAAIGIATEL